jgi:hypothetical protein
MRHLLTKVAVLATGFDKFPYVFSPLAESAAGVPE